MNNSVLYLMSICMVMSVDTALGVCCWHCYWCRKARYSLTVLKVPLNPNSINQLLVQSPSY